MVEIPSAHPTPVGADGRHSRGGVLLVLIVVSAVVLVFGLTGGPSGVKVSMRPAVAHTATPTVGRHHQLATAPAAATAGPAPTAVPTTSTGTPTTNPPAVAPSATSPSPVVAARTTTTTPTTVAAGPAPATAPAVVTTPVTTPLVTTPVVTTPSVAALVAQVEAAGIEPGPRWSWSMGNTATECGAIPGNGVGTGCTYSSGGVATTVFAGVPTLELVAHELANAETETDAVPSLMAQVSAAAAGTSWSSIDAVASCLVEHFMGFQDDAAGSWQCPASLASTVAAHIHDRVQPAT